MGIILLSFLAAGLAVLLVYSALRERRRSAQLKEISESLPRFLHGENGEKLLLFSDDKAVQKLLVALNELLDNRSKLLLGRLRQEESSRRMLANISHDLKTPLTVILGYSEMLLSARENMTEADAGKVEKIYEKARDVLTMINAFFDLAKLEAGDYALQLKSLNLCELCLEEIVNYYGMLDHAGFDVDVRIPEEEIKVNADPAAVKRILGNLVQNAVKYGADGKYLGLKVWEEEEFAWIEVSDRGKGIVEESQDKIFERLATLEDSRNKKYQGSGLGLTITKRLAGAMGGGVYVESRPFEKTAFTVRLPLTKM